MWIEKEGTRANWSEIHAINSYCKKYQESHVALWASQSRWKEVITTCNNKLHDRMSNTTHTIQLVCTLNLWDARSFMTGTLITSLLSQLLHACECVNFTNLFFKLTLIVVPPWIHDDVIVAGRLSVPCFFLPLFVSNHRKMDEWGNASLSCSFVFTFCMHNPCVFLMAEEDSLLNGSGFCLINKITAVKRDNSRRPHVGQLKESL